MPASKLPPHWRGRRILIAEDNFILADNLTRKLNLWGLEVVGPASTVGQALALLDENWRIDGAILDLSLGHENSFPIVDRLRTMHVRAVFLSGFANDRSPGQYRDIPRFQKPADAKKVLAALLDPENPA